MKALITGANGQLGRALQKLLPDAIVTDHTELDITDAQAVESFDYSSIDVIYNAAAYTKVDAAETEILPVWKINATAVAHLAKAARDHDITLVHVSTDYVFDGTAKEPYAETDLINPQGLYGVTKAASELAAAIAPKHYVVRTSWVYGDGPNFVRTMLKLGQDRDELTVVSDQLGRPTNADDLAKILVQLADQQIEYGAFHCTNSGDIISWADFATAIFKTAKLDCKVTPVTTAQYLEGKTGIAPRPAYSALSMEKLESQGLRMPEWQESLKKYLESERS